MPYYNNIITVLLITALSSNGWCRFDSFFVHAVHVQAVEHDQETFCEGSNSNHNSDSCNNKSKIKRKPKSKQDRGLLNSEYPYDEELCGCLPLHKSAIRGGDTRGEEVLLGEGAPARIAYLITLHNQRTLKQSLQLLKAIASPGFIILIHIDTKFHKDNYENSELMSFINDSHCKCCGANVMVESLFNCAWGQWSMMEPTIWAMEQLSNNPVFKNKWDVFINISADSMPVYTPKALSEYYFNQHNGPLNGLNFVTSSVCLTGLRPTSIHYYPQWFHKSGHYLEGGPFYITYSGNDNDNYHDEDYDYKKAIDLEIHFGSQWLTLTPQFVKYIATSMKNSNSVPYRFKEELVRRNKLMSDETFIPTILANHVTFKKTLPKMLKDGNLESHKGFSAIRYERMDENTPDPFMNVVEQQRYDVPKLYEGIIESPRPWGPYYLGVYDLGNIKDSGALFIRKVANELDPNLVNILPVNDKNEIPYIQWPEELKISEKIDWEKGREMFLQIFQGE